MKARHIIGLMATVVTAAGLGAAPAAAKYRIPEDPGAILSKPAGQPAPKQRSAKRVVSVGWNDRYGLELYAPVGGGVRMG